MNDATPALVGSYALLALVVWNIAAWHTRRAMMREFDTEPEEYDTMGSEKQEQRIRQLWADVLTLHRLVAYLMFSLPEDVRTTFVEHFDLPTNTAELDPEDAKVFEEARSRFLGEYARWRGIHDKPHPR